MTKKEKEARKEKAIEYLKEYLKPGDRVYTVLNHASRSGMMRHIDVVIPTKSDDGTLGIYRISHLVADVLDYRQADDGSLKVGGCGMDMGFHVVYGLSRVLFRDSFHCIGEKCRSNDHSNDRDGSWSREKPENIGRLDSDGGYALTQSW